MAAAAACGCRERNPDVPHSILAQIHIGIAQNADLICTNFDK
jgi:hypothetical protein